MKICYNEFMLKIIGRDVWRGDEKIGWVSGNDVYNKEGHKVGYFSRGDGHIYDSSMKKIGYIEENHLYMVGRDRIRLDDNRKEVTGGALDDIDRAAVRLLLGD